MVEQSAAEMAAEFESSTEDFASMKQALKSAESELGEATEQDEKPKESAQAEVQVETPEPVAEVVPEAKDLLKGDNDGTATYTVLKATRAKVHALEAEKAELLKRIKAASTPAKTAEVEDAPLSEDWPDDLKAYLRQVNSKLKAATEELSGMKQMAAETQQRAQAEATTSVQTAIDAQPLLAEWQAEGGEKWAAAQAVDARLMTNPAWAGKSLSERFAKAVQLVSIEFDLPIPKAEPVPQATTKPAPTPAKKPVVVSISDLSGGGQQALDERDTLENSSARQLAASMSTMSKSDLQRMLRETG